MRKMLGGIVLQEARGWGDPPIPVLLIRNNLRVDAVEKLGKAKSPAYGRNY